MFKFLSSLVLIGIIIASIAYCTLYFFLNLAPPDNDFNQIYRKKILVQPILRHLLKMHQPGDARFALVAANTDSDLFIKPFYQDGESLSPQTISIVQREIGRLIPAPRKVMFEDPVIIRDVPGEVNDKALNDLINVQFPVPLLSDKPEIGIFVLQRYEPYPTYAGLVLNDNSIFIFEDAIRDVSDKQKSPVSAEASTILHEFGHLLGADHINVADCIMSDTVENSTFFNLPSDIRDTYCDVDINEIKSALTLN